MGKELSVDVSMQIGYLRKELESKGVTDIGVIAGYMQELKNLQCGQDVHSYDRYAKNGSDTVCDVATRYNRKTQECISWGINNYLGLNRNANVIKKAQAALEKYGTGSGSSAMAGVMSELHIELENRIASAFDKEAALIFPAGYAAHLGVISSLAGVRDLILVDREVHAGILGGCRLSGRKPLTFKHNDVGNLEMKLKKYRYVFENILVIVESAYSMSGEFAPIEEIVRLKEKYKFRLLVDEAHTFGIYGDNGAGYCSELGVTKDVDFVVGTFSDATASIGGFVAAEKKYCTLIRWGASSYLFQACAPPADIATILASLDEIAQNPALINRLHKNNNYFRRQLEKAGFNLGSSQSPIIPVYIEDTGTLYNLERDLYANGIFTSAITFPAVKPGEGRLRFVVTASHTKEQIDKTVGTLRELARRYKHASNGVIPLGQLLNRPTPGQELADESHAFPVIL